MEEPPWKKLKLSLERPYKDDEGRRIPVLLDITPDGQHIYEPKEDPLVQVGENLRRIFVERGLDFFDKRKQDRSKAVEPRVIEDEPDEQEESQGPKQPMTPEELFRMRMEILPQLHIALGEMSQARELLSLLLASASISQPQPSSQMSTQQLLSQMSNQVSAQPFAVSQLPPSALTAAVVKKPPPIPSVQAFNAELVVGGKDKALRKAADLFRSAAQNMESGRVRSEQYWLEALKMRRGNWGLVPAPLPPGSAMGKGADKTSKDFLVSFGLEESPSLFRRRAIGRMPPLDISESRLEFPLRQHTRLQVSLLTTDKNGVCESARNARRVFEETSLEESLRGAQAEVVEQEIFSALIKEASSLPTASARVSERLIVIEAAQGVELCFELIDSETNGSETFDNGDAAKCDLIFAALHVLLLRAHTLLKSERLKRTGGSRVSGLLLPLQAPPLLQPVIDILQYQVFCERIHAEVNKTVGALLQAGVPTELHYEAVGSSGEEFIAQLRENKPKPIGGEALIRVDNRHTLRFTFLSPSSLIAHLPQATLPIASIPQLSQLLAEEISTCLLKRICEIGTERCSSVNGTWFVDLLTSRSVGRWEGCVLHFRVTFMEDFSVVCTASRLDRIDKQTADVTETYRAQEESTRTLFEWAGNVIEATMSKEGLFAKQW